ncbi:peptidoglycan recognition family protein [Pricia sp. S334]|uniref:N-acetylmuramoyl-L-alanine amidase n=1 Tax=Pricia mediterranea TaxID=3076079 RepID=A0ABU3LB17_9FLAO|nr:peptidoglycan recognition family protein [Pricia sp. S334]MDT7830702.1 peptidoglycan recognition family protein [Pricia sp. S334]
MKKMMLPLALMLLQFSCKSQLDIIDKPIIFDETRRELTLEYLKDHYGLDQDVPDIDPKMIVLHWTAIPTFEGSFDAFYKVRLPSWRPDIANASALNVSSHFLVDQDGTIYRLMPETIMARHVIGLNHTAIGVENVGGTEEMPLTDAQLEANIALVKFLTHKYNIEYLIGHYEYTDFEAHPLWMEKDDGYRTKKTDPGTDFMRKVREATENLDFKQNP